MDTGICLAVSRSPYGLNVPAAVHGSAVVNATASSVTSSVGFRPPIEKPLCPWLFWFRRGPLIVWPLLNFAFRTMPAVKLPNVHTIDSAFGGVVASAEYVMLGTATSVGSAV